MITRIFLLTAILSVFLLFGISCTSFSQNTLNNFKIAYIDKIKDSLIVTITGRRRLMVHDPMSLVKDHYYIDSAKIVIPQNKEFIKCNEVRAIGADYPIVKGGVRVKKDSLNVDVYFNDYDEHKIESWTWNGTYKIFWR